MKMSEKIERINELLIESETLFATFIEEPNSLACSASEEGKLFHFKGDWVGILGWSEEELSSNPFMDFVHSDDIERTQEVWSGMNVDLVEGFINRYKTKDGRYAILKWNATSLQLDGIAYSAITFMGYDDD